LLDCSVLVCLSVIALELLKGSNEGMPRVAPNTHSTAAAADR
jgi:hypothetical protein